MALILGLLLTLCVRPGLAQTAQPPAAPTVVAVPAWTSPVMDLSRTLDAAQVQALTEQVRAVESSQGAQLFVLLVPTTGSDTIEQYARRVFDQWAVGRKGVDDGVLLLAAVQDRRLRIEVGYGLEGAVTDVAAGRIIREQITSRFAQGDIFGGLQAGVNALRGLMSGEDLPPPRASSDDEDIGPAVMALPVALMSMVTPVWLSMLLVGGLTFLATNSLGWAALGVLGGLLLFVAGRALGVEKRLNRSRSRSGRRGGGGPGGGFGGGGGGFGGGGGGSGGGGGGRGGGGGASGGW